jgi:tetratricopeptide (TPR) repeat protein
MHEPCVNRHNCGAQVPPGDEPAMKTSSSTEQSAPASLSAAIFESFRRVHAALGSLFGIIIGLLVWITKPETSIPVYWVVGLGVLFSIITWTLVDALYIQILSKKHSYDPILLSIAKPPAQGTNILLAKSHYNIPTGTLLSIFQNEKGFEKFAGLAEVIERQGDNTLQVRIHPTSTALMSTLYETSGQEGSPENILIRIGVSLRNIREQRPLVGELIGFEDKAPKLPPGQGMTSTESNLQAKKNEETTIEQPPTPSSAEPKNIESETKKDGTDFISMVVAALKISNFEEAERVFRADLDKKQESDLKRKRRLVNFRRMQFDFGYSKALDELESLTTDLEAGPLAYAATGQCFASIGEHAKALDHFKQARIANGGKSDEVEAAAVVGIAQTLKAIGNPEDGLNAIESFIRTSKNDVEAWVYESLARMYEESGQDKLSAVAMLAAFGRSSSPGDNAFDAAYSLSKVGFDVAAAGVYKADLKFSKKSAASLNNLAAIYDNFEIFIEAVDIYEQAIEQGSARSCGNLAYKAIGAGFRSLAQKYIDNGLKLENTDERVGAVISSLASAVQAEEEEKRKLEAKSIKMRAFLTDFAKSAWRSIFDDLYGLSGVWIDADGAKSEASITSGQLTITGEGSNPKKYSGRLCGGAACLDRQERTYDFSSTGNQYSWRTKGEAMLFVSPSLDSIEILDLVNSKEPKYIKLRRVPENSLEKPKEKEIAELITLKLGGG